MDNLIRQYDICKRLIDFYQTQIHLMDLHEGNTNEEWKKAENKLRELLVIQKEIVKCMESDPDFKKFTNDLFQFKGR